MSRKRGCAPFAGASWVWSGPRSTPLYSSAASDVYKRQWWMRIIAAFTGGLIVQVGWLVMRVGGHPTLSPHSSNEPGEHSQRLRRNDSTINIIVVLLQRAQCSHCKRCIGYGNSVRLSVCLSVTGRYCVKTAARSTVQLAPLDSKMCLVL